MQKKLLLIIPILFFLNINELKVISYNIRYNNSNDGVNIWENRRSTIKNFIVDENPDFAGLQEVTYSQLIFLTESLTVCIASIIILSFTYSSLSLNSIFFSDQPLFR